MSWQVIDGPIAVPKTGDSEDRLWVLRSDEGEETKVLFRRAGTAGAMAPDALPPRVLEAVNSWGKTELKRMLAWSALPREIVAGSAWLTLQHRSGTFSCVGQRAIPIHRDPVLNFEAQLRQRVIAVDHRFGVRFEYEFMDSHWVKRSLEKGRLKGVPQPYLLTDVLSELSLEDDRQRALDLDPKSAAAMSPDALLAQA
jgi:hypothetical protein